MTVFGHVFVCLIIFVFEYLCICVWKTGWGFVCFCYPVGWEFETWVSSSMVRALPTRRRVIPWWPHVRLPGTVEVVVVEVVDVVVVRLPGTGRCRRRPLFENLIICLTLASLRLLTWCNSQLQGIVLFEVFSLYPRHLIPHDSFGVAIWKPQICHLAIGWFEP